MEKHLETINLLIKNLNEEKEKIRKKLYEKILDKCHIGFETEEEYLFKRASITFKDEEYEKLTENYIKLNDLTRSIDYILKDD